MSFLAHPQKFRTISKQRFYALTMAYKISVKFAIWEKRVDFNLTPLGKTVLDFHLPRG